MEENREKLAGTQGLMVQHGTHRLVQHGNGTTWWNMGMVQHGGTLGMVQHGGTLGMVQHGQGWLLSMTTYLRVMINQELLSEVLHDLTAMMC